MKITDITLNDQLYLDNNDVNNVEIITIIIMINNNRDEGLHDVKQCRNNGTDKDSECDDDDNHESDTCEV